MSPIVTMKTHFFRHKHRRGFTLAEVALAMAVTAGLLAILTSMMSILTRDVRRLKPYEAWRRPAFDAKSGGSSSSSGTTTVNDDSAKSSDTKTPTHTLPDENLNPGSRPDENSIPPDPDDPESSKKETSPAGGDTSTPPST